MKIAIDKPVLVLALDTILKAVPSSRVAAMPILEGVLLEAKGNQLHFTRNNFDIAIKYTVDCEVLESGEAVVNTKLFTDIVKRMADEEIDIKTTGKKMEIEAGQARMEIAVISAEGYPEMMEVDSKSSFEIEQQTLKEMVNGVAFAVSDDEINRPTLTGIFINIEDGILDIVGIDGYIVAWRKAATNLANLRTLLKGKGLENICRLFDKGNIKVSANENLVELTLENMQVILSVVEGEYMNYKKFIPVEFKTTAKVNVKDFRQALERSLLLREVSDGKLKGAMVIDITEKGFKLTLKGCSGMFDEDFKAEVEGVDESMELKIGFDPLKIYECLKRIGDDEIVMKFTTNIGPCIITPVEGDSFTYMVLPVRIKE